MQFADIAVNLGDGMFQGKYHGKQRHPRDLEAVLDRARAAGVTRQLLTGTSLRESRLVLKYAQQYDLHSTAGCHPTSTAEIDKHRGGEDAYFQELEDLIASDLGEGGSKRIISLGEIGLDYDRLKFAPKETQLKHLPRLLLLSKKFNLPMFLHDRHPEAHRDFVRILKEVGFGPDWPGGVAHSFTGTMAEMKELVDMGLYIGVNGCSLKTQENVDVVKAIPLDRLMLETDAPWCSVTTSHASYKHLPKDLVVVEKVKPEKFVEGKGVKGRNEPADVVVIAHIVASIRGESLEKVANAAFDNTMRLFYHDEVKNLKDAPLW
jgi:TatD DNase family protein